MYNEDEGRAGREAERMFHRVCQRVFGNEYCFMSQAGDMMDREFKVDEIVIDLERGRIFFIQLKHQGGMKKTWPRVPPRRFWPSAAPLYTLSVVRKLVHVMGDVYSDAEITPENLLVCLNYIGEESAVPVGRVCGRR